MLMLLRLFLFLWGIFFTGVSSYTFYMIVDYERRVRGKSIEDWFFFLFMGLFGLLVFCIGISFFGAATGYVEF
jgi:hypothetical protein